VEAARRAARAALGSAGLGLRRSATRASLGPEAAGEVRRAARSARVAAGTEGAAVPSWGPGLGGEGAGAAGVAAGEGKSSAA